MNNLPCVCEGNWRLLISEYIDKVDTIYNDDRGGTWRFIGLIDGKDDYYYGMCNVKTGKLTMLSCVGHIESYGFDAVIKDA